MPVAAKYLNEISGRLRRRSLFFCSLELRLGFYDKETFFWTYYGRPPLHFLCFCGDGTEYIIVIRLVMERVMDHILSSALCTICRTSLDTFT